jgi:enoyl-CoA hydratase/carnithine racemase
MPEQTKPTEAASVVLCEIEDGVATVTLNRPQALNALNVPVWVELQRIVADLGKADDVHVVIITGAGRCFSAGNDIKSMRDPTPGISARIQLEVIDAIEALPQPVIAAVHGFCLTGALELILACDLVLAAETSRIGDTHAKWGLVPTWGGNMRLPRRVGISQAKEMVYTCRFYSGAESQQIGLVNQVVPDDELLESARALAVEIKENSRESIAKQKRIINTGWEHSLADGLQWVERFHPGSAADMAERLSAFAKK